MCIGGIKVNGSTKKMNIIEVSGYHPRRRSFGHAYVGMISRTRWNRQLPLQQESDKPNQKASQNVHAPTGQVEYGWSLSTIFNIHMNWKDMSGLTRRPSTDACERVYIVSFKQQLLRNIQSKRTILTLSIFEHLKKSLSLAIACCCVRLASTSRSASCS